jgi:hypothetical protein
MTLGLVEFVKVRGGSIGAFVMKLWVRILNSMVESIERSEVHCQSQM